MVPRATAAVDGRTIAILRCGDAIPSVVARRGDFPAWIAAPLWSIWDGPIVEIELRADETPPDFSRAAGLIVSGSSSSVTERAPWMLRAEALLRDAVAREQPLLGICFGHQILAQALGGEVETNPAGREIGTVDVDKLVDDPIFDGLPSSFAVNATHVDTVALPPPGATTLASTALEATAAFAIGNARAVQFHPEIDGDVMRGYLDARREILAREGFDVEPMIERARDVDAGPRILQNFVRRFVADR